MADFARLTLHPPVAPTEAKLVDALPSGPDWRFEPKWDGFRCLVFRDGTAVELQSKSGKPLTRYFPEIVETVASLDPDRFVLDGELIVTISGILSFEALQLRLHPAESRVRKLAAEQPAQLMLFDCLVMEGRDLTASPLDERRVVLEDFHRRQNQADLLLSPQTPDRNAARSWLDIAGGALDGVIAKNGLGGYESGERAMLKIKQLRTADCVVGGFRYAAKGGEVGSLLLGLYDDEGRLNHVGFTSAIPASEKAELTATLEALVEPPGFTGRAPGGPSRWATERSGEWRPLRPQLVAEVRYDHVSGERFRHGTKFLRWRPDKDPLHCRMDQLHPPSPPDAAGL